MISISEIDSLKKIRGILFVLVGPSGVGKNTIMKNLIGKVEGLQQLPTVTTRQPRVGEEEGREHFFVGIEKFNQMIKKNQLVEFQEVYPGKYYGVPLEVTQRLLSQLKLLIADVEVIGAKKLKECFPKNVITIFISPPNLNILLERIKNRGFSDEKEIEERSARWNFELNASSFADYLVINNEIDICVDEIIKIINKIIAIDNE